jgi:predicted small metal-binding protein
LRAFECDCGKLLEAPDDAQLYDRVWEHMEQTHFDRGLSNEEIKNLVSERAYTEDVTEKGAIDERGSVGG